MRQIEMSAKELLILAAHLGAENLLGVRDPFESLERADLTAEIPQILIDAEKKGLVELNFEGTFSVAPETANLLKPSAFCTKYISVEYSRNGQLQKGRNLYVGEHLVLLEQSGDHVLIRETKPEQAVEDLLSGSGGALPPDAAKAKGQFILPLAQLSVLRELSEKEAVEQLTAGGCPAYFAWLVSASLHQRTVCCVLTLADYETGTMRNCILIREGQNCALLEMLETEEDTPLRVQGIDDASLRALLKSFLEQLLTKGEA